MPETAVSCESGTFPRVQKCSDAHPFHRMTQTIGEDQVVVGVRTTENLLGALLLALPCLKLVGNGRRNKNPANARFGPGLFQNEHARVALRALRVEEKRTSFCSRDFMAVLSTRWSSFSIMMDAVPAAMLFGEISTQSHVRPRISPIYILHAKDVLIASFRWASSQTSSARKIVSASQTSRLNPSLFG